MKALALAACGVFAFGSGFTACAKHVRLHAYYATWQDSARFVLANGQVTIGCLSAPDVAFVDLTFHGVPEWLNGDSTLAYAGMGTGNLTINGVPATGATFFGWRQCLTTGECFDDYFFGGKIGIGGVNQIVITPPSGPTPLLHNIYVGHDGCWNTFANVPLRPKSCPCPAGTCGGSGAGCRQYQTAAMIPATSKDQLDACQWRGGACHLTGLIRVCDPDTGCDSECPDGYNFDMLSGVQDHESLCCNCGPL